MTGNPVLTTAVLVDCDGVLVDSEPFMEAVLRRELRAHGVTLTARETAARFRGRAFTEIGAEVREQFQVALPAGFARAVTDRALAALEWELSAVPGVFALLKRVRVPVCVVSNAPGRRVTAALHSVGLGALFAADRIVAREDATRGKPAPDLFLAAAARLGEHPRSCVAVEDSVTGAVAAREAGMRVVGFTGTHEEPGRQAEALSGAGCFATARDMAALAGILHTECGVST
ncbi:HAD family hydrolase [Longispora urticae]